MSFTCASALSDKIVLSGYDLVCERTPAGLPLASFGGRLVRGCRGLMGPNLVALVVADREGSKEGFDLGAGWVAAGWVVAG